MTNVSLDVNFTGEPFAKHFLITSMQMQLSMQAKTGLPSRIMIPFMILAVNGPLITLYQATCRMRFFDHSTQRFADKDEAFRDSGTFKHIVAQYL